jgi:hypothetical protein
MSEYDRGHAASAGYGFDSLKFVAKKRPFSSVGRMGHI